MDSCNPTKAKKAQNKGWYISCYHFTSKLYKPNLEAVGKLRLSKGRGHTKFSGDLRTNFQITRRCLVPREEEKTSSTDIEFNIKDSSSDESEDDKIPYLAANFSHEVIYIVSKQVF